MPLIQVALVTDIPAGRGKSVDVNGTKIALFAEGGRVFAVGDVCPHRGAPLSEGMCREGQVMCPWHAARFDLATGKHLCPPARADIAVFPAQIQGEAVLVELP